MNKTTKVSFVYWLLTLISRYPTTSGARELSHVRNPVQLSVGQCISFEAHPTYRAVGNWTWRKDTIAISASDRIVIHNNVLSISDVKLEDSAYYSAEVQTTERRELFRFWLTVTECDSNEKKNPYFQGSCKSWCEKKCEQGWKHFDGGCFKYFGEIKSWEDALDSCQALDAKLAVVNDGKKNDNAKGVDVIFARFIGSLLESGEGAWIGLNDRYSESVYFWNNDKKQKASYFSWAKDEPSNTNSKCNIENCVEMKYPNLKWNDMICNGYNSYVCQLNKDNANVSSSWSCYGTNCFRYFSNNLIWKDSKMNCEELGGELARITSSSVSEFVGKLISNNVWIGLNDIVEPGTYVWKNVEVGKLFDKTSFFNWDDGEPNDKFYDARVTERCSGEDCVQLNQWNNVVSWYDLECSKKIPYVCEKTRDSLLTLAAIIGISVGCTAVVVILAALIQFRLKNRKHKVQVQRLVFKTRS